MKANILVITQKAVTVKFSTTPTLSGCTLPYFCRPLSCKAWHL